jgi:hypothetical protein
MPGDQPLAPDIIDAYHLGTGPPVEQHRLCGEIVLQVSVEVEVILGQVGERADRESGSVHPAQRQRVAGYLDGHVSNAAFDHQGQQSLQLRSLRRGEGTGQQCLTDPCCHGAEQAGMHARRP